MEIQTRRLLLRPMAEADAPAVYEYSKHPDVGPRAGWKPHGSLAETREIMRAVFLGRDDVWAIVRRADGKLIGSIGLIPDPARENGRTRMVGYALDAACWGQGYMTEAVRGALRHAFGALSLDLVSATCYPGNPASRRVLEKCGFRLEGRRRLAKRLWDGTVQDHLCFSITRDEYA